MARRYEGSAEDRAEDARGARKLGMSKKAYESSPQDRAQDAAGEKRFGVKAHTRKAPGPRAPKAPPPPPMPGQYDFSADEEKQMRAGMRAKNNPPPAPAPGNDGDADDFVPEQQ
jgi:hypothetical protein